MTDVKRLLDEATPLPWRVDKKPDGQTYGVVVAECEGSFVWANGNANDWGDEEIARLIGERDAALIVHAVNRLPDYEVALDALERVVTATDQWHEGGPRAGLRLDHALVAARTALRRLRGES